MRTNILYAGIFILAVIIIFAIAFNKKEAPEPSAAPLLKENRVEAVRREALKFDTGEPVSFTQQAITVIKPARKIDSPIVGPEREEETLDLRISGYSYGQGSSVSAGREELEDTEVTVSGVTRAGKYPTEEEAKDMNSKGIVLY